MRYQFLVDTYETERLKVLSMWSMFRDDDLETRPHVSDRRGRSAREQMVHQCMSENIWFSTMLGIDVGAQPLPEEESREEFIRRYAKDSAKRLDALRTKDEGWWPKTTSAKISRPIIISLSEFVVSCSFIQCRFHRRVLSITRSVEISTTAQIRCVEPPAAWTQTSPAVGRD